MSKLFGLDWYEVDAKRIYYFMEIINAENKKTDLESRKSS